MLRSVFLLLCTSTLAANASPFVRTKRQYESEIIAISPRGRWTSVFHQPLDAIREKGLPLLEHQGALREVQTYQQPGSAFSPAAPFTFGQQPPSEQLLQALYAQAQLPVQAYPPVGAPRYLYVLPPGAQNIAAAPGAPVSITSLPVAVPASAAH